jgi:hypothetical protein
MSENSDVTDQAGAGGARMTKIANIYRGVQPNDSVLDSSMTVLMSMTKIDPSHTPLAQEGVVEIKVDKKILIVDD